MTTIVYRNGILAADSQITFGSKLMGATKIVRAHDGVLAGAGGKGGYAREFLDWAVGDRRSTPPEAKEGDDFMDRGCLFYPDARVEVFEASGRMIYHPPYYAFGSGGSEALGALYMGATAEQAVAAAIAHDIYTGGDILTLSHGSPTPQMTQKGPGKSRPGRKA
jgi:hypothetical protein